MAKLSKQQERTLQVLEVAIPIATEGELMWLLGIGQTLARSHSENSDQKEEKEQNKSTK